MGASRSLIFVAKSGSSTDVAVATPLVVMSTTQSSAIGSARDRVIPVSQSAPAASYAFPDRSIASTASSVVTTALAMKLKLVTPAV